MNVIRIFKIYLGGKRKLFVKMSQNRFFRLLLKTNSIHDRCYTAKEINYLGNKLF